MAARCLIAFVFLASVAGKLRNRASLGGFVSSVPVLAGWPTGPVRLLAVVVVAVEAAVPILLAVPGAGTAALVVAAVTVVVIALVVRLDDVADVLFPAQHPHRGIQLESGSNRWSS